MSLPCYFNGEFTSSDQPLFESNDLGILRGYAIFDYFRTYNGVPFRWNDYWNRFITSAAKLNLDFPYSQSEIYDVVMQLHRRSGQAETAFRFVLTGGYAPDSVHIVQPNFLIRAEKLPIDNPAGRVKGIKVLSYEYLRDLPEIKSTNYIHMVLMDQHMKSQQASDLLFHKNGEISELTRSNIFLFKDNQLITPNRNILYGITRKTVIELAQPYFQVIERNVTLAEFLQADEVFTTSTTKWVMPVVQVDDQLIGTGSAGKKTLFLQNLLEQYVSEWGK
jgi:branched-chain amino acid aminotransferase